jgi:hypothetical protein
MSPDLTAAVENAYRLFRRYSLSGGIVVCNCNCCVHPENEKRLIGTPPRDISCALLTEYTNSAHGWDNNKIADDFRYLLPRYFELIANGEIPTNSYEAVTLSRLGDASYATAWPADEVAAIDQYFRALFEHQLVSPLVCRRYARTDLIDCEGADIEQTLMIIANAGADIAPLLAHWDTTPAREADLRIAAIAGEINVLKPEGRFSEWDVRSAAAHRTLRAWIGRWEVRQRIEDACLREEDPVAASLLSIAEQVIAALAWRADRHGQSG